MGIERVGNVSSVGELRNRTRVFEDRADAGLVLAGMLESYRGSDAIILAIPSGGVPVAVAIAEHLGLPLDVAVVSKITPPWNAEIGYGAVAYDGTVELNVALLEQLRLAEEQIEAGLAATRGKVARRVLAFRGDRPLPIVAGRPAVLVDDGLASGFTMRVAIAAVRRLGARSIVVAVPTGGARRIELVAGEADEVYCANIRGGWSFAVADAYERWADVDEQDAVAAFRGSSATRSAGPA